MFIVRMTILNTEEAEKFFGEAGWTEAQAHNFSTALTQQGNLFGATANCEVIKVISPGELSRPVRLRRAPQRPTTGGDTE